MTFTDGPEPIRFPAEHSPGTTRHRGWIGGVLALLLIVSSTGCAKDEKKVALTDLKTGIAVVEYLTRHDILLISNFPRLYPRKRAKDFVQWMFTAAAQSTWPITEAMIDAHPDLEGWRDLPGYPLLSKSVHLVPDEPDPQYQRQVVVRAGDGPDSILAEAYLTADTPPVLTREFILPELHI